MNKTLLIIFSLIVLTSVTLQNPRTSKGSVDEVIVKKNVLIFENLLN